MKTKLVILTVLTVILAIAGITVFPNFIQPFSPENLSESIILHEIRIPKTITAILCGSALSVSGFILQQLFKNQLAGPYILGVSSGASLSVAITILGARFIPVLSSDISIPIAGFIGAFGILMIVLMVSSRFGYGPIILLLGVIIGQLSGALQGLLSYMANPGDLKHFTLWSMGSFSQVLDQELLLLGAGTLIGLIWAFTLMPNLNIMILGDDVATTLGVNTSKTSFQLLACTGLLTGLSTAYCGPIAFIGMAIPNLVKMLFKTSNYKTLLIANVLLGSIMALVSDMVSSLNLSGMNIPVNVTTALIGGPFIIYILLKKNPA
ncbi:MAG TPA: iron ABC transporter permease [Bacteroidia bacterium]